MRRRRVRVLRPRDQQVEGADQPEELGPEELLEVEPWATRLVLVVGASTNVSLEEGRTPHRDASRGRRVH